LFRKGVRRAATFLKKKGIRFRNRGKTSNVKAKVSEGKAYLLSGKELGANILETYEPRKGQEIGV